MGKKKESCTIFALKSINFRREMFDHTLTLFLLVILNGSYNCSHNALKEGTRFCFLQQKHIREHISKLNIKRQQMFRTTKRHLPFSFFYYLLAIATDVKYEN